MPNEEGDPSLSYPLTTDLTLLLLFRVPQSTRARHVSDCWVGGQRNIVIISERPHLQQREIRFGKDVLDREILSGTQSRISSVKRQRFE